MNDQTNDGVATELPERDRLLREPSIKSRYLLYLDNVLVCEVPPSTHWTDIYNMMVRQYGEDRVQYRFKSSADSEQESPSVGLYHSIKLGIETEAESDSVSIPPGDLTDEQVKWLAHWLAGEGWENRPSIHTSRLGNRINMEGVSVSEDGASPDITSVMAVIDALPAFSDPQFEELAAALGRAELLHRVRKFPGYFAEDDDTDPTLWIEGARKRLLSAVNDLKRARVALAEQRDAAETSRSNLPLTNTLHSSQE